MRTELHIKKDEIRQATCPACGYYVAVPFLRSEPQPLATLAWPETADEAINMVKLPLDFLRCVECGHIFNAAFTYDDVPYSSKPNLMFNSGASWSHFIRKVQQTLLSRIPENPTVIEIGHGDGSFIAALAKSKPGGTFIGFDPNGAAGGCDNVQFRAEYFDPAIHLPELQPDLVISRHVLEHLTNPLGFLQRISFVAATIGLQPLAYFEVPCVDRALENNRTVDFYYEHSSHFTSTSFMKMISTCGATVKQIGHGYDGEVIYGLMVLSGTPHHLAHADESLTYRNATDKAMNVIKKQLIEISASVKKVALWGGTGKSAAFIDRYCLDSKRFPVVVDSDKSKVGTFVPGTGQVIRFRDYLIENPVDIIIIPPQWRARDIIQEMQKAGISTDQILIEHDGRLTDFHRDSHPYGGETI